MYELKRQFSTVEYREKTHVYQTGGLHIPLGVIGRFWEISMMV